ncbi:Putative GTP cyclohydrolase 1 type 2, NIF3 family [Anaerovirgula multivorans]|uniref:GTP cyclohydrolase 1 type 2 homolog n=1 Tax=Anaerovirgula multivorans TaxID=312168 RepID=A0A239D2T2_9FIRM|nr:Nif3-like dinuclear metal center hexameric protein [Anaerovirgula multivorans]SNS26171.1 Putative GTP cyclohydrolase 1 type 2, NIF3 family [Anaerovirgula multivorans]
MLANELYNRLDEDFDIKNIRDDWSFMDFNSYIAPTFKSKYMGLILDNSHNIEKVYTATFPDKEIIEKILNTNEFDVLLFSHHAMGYRGNMEGFPFYNIPIEYLKEMKKRRISFYMLHAPLDRNGEYSTSVNLAKALNLEVVDEFCQYDNIKVGVICKTSFKSVLDFSDYVKKVIGHDIKLRNYGELDIRKGKVAIAAGGGSYPFVATELADLGINVYLTGFTKPLQYFELTMEFHKIAKDNQINVIGATHYSTEKYACISMVDYFKKLGVCAEFLEGKYFLEDL